MDRLGNFFFCFHSDKEHESVWAAVLEPATSTNSVNWLGYWQQTRHSWGWSREDDPELTVVHFTLYRRCSTFANGSWYSFPVTGNLSCPKSSDSLTQLYILDCWPPKTSIKITRRATDLAVGGSRRSPCRSHCCPPPGNWDSSRTCWRCHPTREAECGPACAHGSPSLSPAHLQYQTTPREETGKGYGSKEGRKKRIL